MQQVILHFPLRGFTFLLILITWIFFFLNHQFILPPCFSLSLTLFMSLSTHTHTSGPHALTSSQINFKCCLQLLAWNLTIPSCLYQLGLKFAPSISLKLLWQGHCSVLNPVESSQPMTILTMFFLKCSSSISSAPCTFIFPELLCLLSKIQFFSINWWSSCLNHDLKSLFTATY